MSELDRTLTERIARFRPAIAPPFTAISARRRRRVAAQSGVAGLAVLGVLGGAVAVSAHRFDQPDTLVQPGARTSAAPSITPVPSPPPVVGGRQQPGPADKAAYELWKQKGSKNYSFTLVRTCFCVGGDKPVTVTVRDGRVQPPVGPASQGNGALKSIDEIFDILLTSKADRFTVRYDETYGFPVHVRLDYILHAIDDEMEYTISGYRPA